MAYLKTEGIDLYYECHGSGPPLMLIAGIASDGQSWMPVVPELSRSFTLILPDNRGAGQTRLAGAPLSMDAIAGDCAALIAHLGYQRVHVLGHSMGGAIAQILALEHPQCLDRLVLATTGAKLSRRNLLLFQDLAALRQGGVDPVLWHRLLFQWLFRPAFFEDERAVQGAAEQAVAYPHAQSARDFSRQLVATMAVDVRDRLSRISAPTLVLAAHDDLLFPPNKVKALHEAIPAAHYACLEQAGHSLHWDNPSGFCAILQRFLSDGN